MAPATHLPVTPSSSLQSPLARRGRREIVATLIEFVLTGCERGLLTVVAVAAEAVGGVGVVQRRRPVVPELDDVGPRAEAAQVVAGVRGQQVLHRRCR
jgi:hypothetical protein